MRSLALFLVLSFLFAGTADAESLLGFPMVGRGEPRFEIAAVSDFWSSPFQNKESPQRSYRILLLAPLPEHNHWVASLALELDGRIVSRPDLLVGENSVPVGPDLRSQALGFAMRKKSPDQSETSLFLSYGSASDRPSLNSGTLVRSASALYKSFPFEARQWILGLDYSENRGFRDGVVLPFFGVQVNSSPSLRWSFGFPFLKAEWGNADSGAMLEASLVGARFRASRQATSDFNLFFETALKVHSYLHSQRQREDLRLYLEEKSADAGFWLSLSRQSRYGLRAGYAFERKLYESRQALDPVGPGLEIRPDWTIGFQLESLF